MCGIAGIVDFTRRVERPALERMIDLVEHRGPDGRGAVVQGAMGLAHARLSILDVENGRQPMSSADGSLWLTFNGEIFNYVELREELAQRGHCFRTRSDTEVILHMYEEEGEECVRRFNGQWAFALWDARQKKLFLSRDRLGVRPLHYTRAGSAFVFGSEIKSLLEHPDVSRDVDLPALCQLLTFWGPLPSRTVFAGISELPPGHSMRVTESGVETWPYWRLDYPTAPVNADARECADELLSLLTDATRIRLRSDVPVGAYLSGGLDSSIIAGLIRRTSTARLRTFSVAFEDLEFDESRYQQEVIRHLETEHEELRCRTDDIGRVFPDVVWHAEKPLFRTAPAPLFLLSERVRASGFKVVLTGEGSDEMLGGYDIFKEAKIRRFWAAAPDSRLRPLLLKKLYPYMQNLQAQPPEYLQAFFRVRPEDVESPFFSHLPRWDLTRRVQAFFSDEVKARLTGHRPEDELLSQLPREFERWSPFCRAQFLESWLLMPGYILSSQGDRVSMAHSVEGRFPFLDHRVVELAARLPPDLKMKVLDEKHLLKRASSGLVPDVVRRRPKQPYRAPDAKCFFDPRGRPLDYVRALLDPVRVQQDGLFHPGMVERLVAKAQRGDLTGTKDNMAFVAILSTQVLLDRFIHNYARGATGR